MNTQINVRLSDDLLGATKEYAKTHGYCNLQDFIKETIREKVFEIKDMTKEEVMLISKLFTASEEKDLYGTEEDLMKKLDAR